MIEARSNEMLAERLASLAEAAYQLARFGPEVTRQGLQILADCEVLLKALPQRAPEKRLLDD